MTHEEETPVVSIIMPAYDAAATIDAQLDAISRQTTSVPFEVLVCDNGSAAEGSQLLFCDADDVVSDDWVAQMVEALAVADVVAGALDARSLNAANRASVSWEVSSEIRMPFWPRFAAGASSNLGIRADAFAKLGGFDERLQTGEDVDLCWRAQLAGFTFGRSHDAVVQSRQRDGLRAVFRQARSYGAGSRALKIKYRDHVAVFDGTLVEEIVIGEPCATDPERGSRGALARARRILSRSGQANLAWRVGEAVGLRYGAVHPGIRPLPRDGSVRPS